MKTRLTTTLAGVALLGLVPTLASATSIDFSFVTEGTLQTDNCGPVCYKIHTQGTSYDFANAIPGTDTWSFSGYMTFFGLPWLAGASAGPSSWSFADDSNNNNDLSGTFDWILGPGGDGIALYNITGGSGLFAGASGIGKSIISITKWYCGLPEFQEVGKMKVTSTTTSVPEPGATTLVAAGLLLLGFAAWRKRPVNVRKD
jgi:hypothetical protein